MKSSLKRIALKTLDYGYSFFVVTPLLVLFWYSTWTAFDVLVASSNQYKMILYAAGLSGQFFLLYHHDVPRRIFNVQNEIASAFLSRFHVLICGVVNICFWRLVWISYDTISSNDNNSIVLNVVQNAAILMALRVFVNSISIPFVVTMDVESEKNEAQEENARSFTYMRKSVSKGCNFL
jgi:hypothetical protein